MVKGCRLDIHKFSFPCVRVFKKAYKETPFHFGLDVFFQWFHCSNLGVVQASAGPAGWTREPPDLI